MMGSSSFLGNPPGNIISLCSVPGSSRGTFNLDDKNGRSIFFRNFVYVKNNLFLRNTLRHRTISEYKKLCFLEHAMNLLSNVDNIKQMEVLLLHRRRWLLNAVAETLCASSVHV
nr:C12 protein - rabbit fibroma virus [Rabbit fibroma virus]